MENPSGSDLDIESTNSWSLQMNMLLEAFDKVSEKLAGHGDQWAYQLQVLSTLRSEVLQVQTGGEETFGHSDSEQYKSQFSVHRQGVRESELSMIELLVRIARLVCVPEYFYTLHNPSGSTSLPNGAAQLASFYQKLEACLNREEPI